MLNFKIAMRYIYTIPLFVSLIIIPTRKAVAQELTPTNDVQILVSSPVPGAALQGTISVEVDIDVEEFISAELSFSYSRDQRDTWFLISEWDETPSDGFSTEWDTTTITDGEYDLRILVITEDEQHTALIPGVRVRNYSPIETNTPLPTSTPAPEDTIAPTVTSTSTITLVPSTSTPQPPNPAHINNRQITSSIGNGAIIAISALALIGLYQFIRNRRRRED